MWGDPMWGDVPAAAPPKPMEVHQREMPVIGFRAWNWSQPHKKYSAVILGSRHMDEKWNTQGATKAKCLCYNSSDPFAHKQPSDLTECGLYVLAKLKDVQQHWDKNQVLGAVMGWGRVVQHGNQGWRAEYAQPIAFLRTDVLEDKPHEEQLSEQYQVPLMDRKGLEVYVKEYGDPLPNEQE